jgi:hypothetical protein
MGLLHCSSSSVESTGSCISYLGCVIGNLVCVSGSVSFRLHAYNFISLAWDLRARQTVSFSIGSQAWGLASSTNFWTREAAFWFGDSTTAYFSFSVLCTPTFPFVQMDQSPEKLGREVAHRYYSNLDGGMLRCDGKGGEGTMS